MRHIVMATLASFKNDSDNVLTDLRELLLTVSIPSPTCSSRKTAIPPPVHCRRARNFELQTDEWAWRKIIEHATQ